MYYIADIYHFKGLSISCYRWIILPIYHLKLGRHLVYCVTTALIFSPLCMPRHDFINFEDDNAFIVCIEECLAGLQLDISIITFMIRRPTRGFQGGRRGAQPCVAMFQFHDDVVASGFQASHRRYHIDDFVNGALSGCSRWAAWAAMSTMSIMRRPHEERRPATPSAACLARTLRTHPHHPNICPRTPQIKSTFTQIGIDIFVITITLSRYIVRLRMRGHITSRFVAYFAPPRRREILKFRRLLAKFHRASRAYCKHWHLLAISNGIMQCRQISWNDATWACWYEEAPHQQ